MINKCCIDSPIGPLTITANDQSVISIEFKGSDQRETSSPLIQLCIDELSAYFNGGLSEFTVPIELSGTPFQNKVWQALTEIPFGTSISYSELAIKLGDLKCIRAAGTANGKNKIPIIIPCHRVIGKDGSLVGFSGGIDKKKWLLKHEGIIRGEQIEIFA
ncbi:MAG: methylated-DNA--[protein]-cysteine S-methyltransferase [Fulvivirga sp.]